MTATIGLFGLGTMGSALALNIAEKGFDLHVANRSQGRVAGFLDEAGPLAARITGHAGLVAMARAMPGPRAIILMVQAGPAVDACIADLIPVLSPGDTIIDAGNADFHDTRRRTATVEAAGLAFLGMGVSGGEEGARHGPSIMAGGTPGVYDGIAPVLRAIAARHKGEPCVAHLGPDGAGHFVKTVHNGIEYADMQMIAEVYGLMRRGRGMSPAAIGAVFADWDKGALQSYLVEITAEVLSAVDPLTGGPVVDVIEDRAGQKGTGRWTVIEALRLGQSATVIEAAVAARSMSAEQAARKAGQAIFGDARGPVALDDDTLAGALLAARITAYAQGFRLLAAASGEFGWGLDHAAIARVWRAGCIIRSALLDEIAGAFETDPPHGQLVFAPSMVAHLAPAIPALRSTVAQAVAAGHAVPALAAALGFLDTLAQGRGTTDLIQAQRDFFGRHGFDRIDGATGEHGPWAG